MTFTTQLARRYFEALSARDLDQALAYWRPGGTQHIVGQRDLTAPDGIRDYFNELFAAFPDWRYEIVDVTQDGSRSAVRWSVRTTFAGPGWFQGFAPTGGTVELEGCDVLALDGGMIVRNDAYADSADAARQLGLLRSRAPAPGTAVGQLAKVRTVAKRSLAGSAAEPVADGVWIVRGGVPRMMNVYLLEEPGGGVTVFDAGVKDMAPAVARAAAHLGGIRRVVLGHADCDHRGSAAALKAPVFVHPLEAEAAKSPSHVREYWDQSKLAPWARPVFPHLFKVWDGAPLAVEGTVVEGDDVAGFRVIELPGHAPGLIGLFRKSDGLALVSDTIYTLNPETGIPGEARVPHPAFNIDTDQARASIRKLIALKPVAVWPGHAKPLTDDVAARLLRAAAA